MGKTGESNIKYPALASYTTPITPPKRQIVGRTQEIKDVIAVLCSPEYTTPALVGEAGAGKTEIVRGLAQYISNPENLHGTGATDLTRAIVLSVNTQALIAKNADGSDAVGYRLQKMVNEVEQMYEKNNVQVILFVDEFHLLKEASNTALQALKPLLAEAGNHHLMMIVATTVAEYDDYIRGDLALDERLVRIDVRPLDDEVVKMALRNYCNVHAKGDYIADTLLYEIIDLTNRYIPSEVQPRKSIKIIDGMVGRHRAFGDEYNHDLLVTTLNERTGIDTSWQADIIDLQKRLKKHVFGQDLAIHAVLNRLAISMARINDHSRPLGSFLFAGTTGVGKTELAKQITIALFGREDQMIRFDMSEYSESSRGGAADLFRERLTAEVYEHPSSIILLDEIEKAENDVAQLLLQVLDDARLTDVHGREISFKNCYIIATTNAAAESFANIQENEGEAMSQGSLDDILDKYLPLIKKDMIESHFRPELLGRFDALVPFAPLSYEVKMRIAQHGLDKLKKEIEERYHIPLKYDGSVIGEDAITTSKIGCSRLLTYLTTSNGRGSNDQYNANDGGGRTINQRIENEIKSPLSKLLVLHPDQRPDVIGVKVIGTLNEEIRNDDGDARIKVARWKPLEN